ncbi:MAG: hypothetical protein ACKO4X_22825 [Alphaproteobacteria bacterium]
MKDFMAQFGARLVDNGYPVIPIMPGAKVPGHFRKGAWAAYPDWTRHCDRPPICAATSMLSALLIAAAVRITRDVASNARSLRQSWTARRERGAA